jgi:hypothetical protein
MTFWGGALAAGYPSLSRKRVTSWGSEQNFRYYRGSREMVGEIFGLTPRVQVWESRGQTTLFVIHFNLRSESTENRALTLSRREAQMV